MFTEITKYIFQIFLLTLPFVLPQIQFADDNGSILTAISLLFAILVGFFIATTTSNYLRLQTLISDTNAGLISIYNLVKSIAPKKKRLVAQAIDQYMIATLDFELLDHVNKTRNEFNQVLKIADETEATSDKGLALIQELHACMDDLLTNDQEIALTSKCIISSRHWLIIILLSVLFAVSLLSFRDGSLIMSLFIGTMYIVIYHLLTLIHEIDTNKFLGRQLSFEEPQQVFQGIGKEHYYPEYAIRKGYATPKSIIYRVGIYKNYPKSFEKKIELIEHNSLQN